MEGRSKLQKAVLISVAAMVVLFGILTLLSHVRKGVEFEGGLLYRRETEDAVTYAGKLRGEQVEITVRATGSGNLTEVDFSDWQPYPRRLHLGDRSAAHSGGPAGACGAHPNHPERSAPF